MQHILLIEDNKDIRLITSELLLLENFKVTTAKNGKEGIEKAKIIKPDLILCDVTMPELSGFEVIKTLQEYVPTSKIPFIFLTAKSEKNDFRKGMSLGADDYITKPFEPQELFDAIKIRIEKYKKENYNLENKHFDNFLQEEVSNSTSLEYFKQTSKVSKFNNKHILFKEGAPAIEIFLIASGNVKTFKISDTGKEFVSGIYGKGEFVGKFSLLSKEGICKDTAMVMDHAEVYVIPKKEFLTLVYENKNISNSCIEMLSNNMIDIQEKLFDMAYTPVRKRAAKALLEFSKKGMIDNKNQIGIKIPREDFAGIIGTAIETAIRTLKDFKNENIIALNNEKHFVITDLKKLKKIANS